MLVNEYRPAKIHTEKCLTEARTFDIHDYVTSLDCSNLPPPLKQLNRGTATVRCEVRAWFERVLYEKMNSFYSQ